MDISSIAIIHASRSRPQMAKKSAESLLFNMRSNMRFHYNYILSLDEDDPFLIDYFAPDTQLLPHRVVSNNKGAVEAMNRGAAISTDEDILMVMSDDLESCVGWDVELKNIVEKIDNPIFYVHLSNVIGGQHKAIVPFLSRAFYEQEGFIFNPLFVSMYADDELVIRARRLGVCYEGNINFIHHHPVFGNQPIGWDDTYRRTNRPENYAQGLSVLQSLLAKG